MKYSLFNIFLRPTYFILALFVALLIFVGIGLFPNISFIKNIILSPAVNTLDTVKIISSLIWDTGTHATSFNTVYTAILALLIGVNISLVVFYVRFRKMAVVAKGGVAGVLGFFSGIVGIGCASCGSILLVSFLPILGLGGLISLLPLRGAEFSILSIILLAWSAKIILRGINVPLVCIPKF